jgi:membrane protein DedA with SNARE-associated domain/rhodanese-related sulfurtransferase
MPAVISWLPMGMVISWLEHVGVGVVFVVVLVEQAGLPLPAYPLLIIAGAWSAQGGAPLGRIMAVAVGACLIADLAWYAAGRRRGSRVLRAMCRLSLEPDSCVAYTESAFARFGTRVLLFAKFVPGLGAVATAMSGVVGASLLGFVVYDGIGATLWAGLGVTLGAMFHDAVDSVFAELAVLGQVGALLIVGFFAAFLAWKLWRRHQFFQELRMNRISVAELSGLLAAGSALTLIDARPQASRARDGIIPGALDFEALVRGAGSGRYQGEVVVYCACPNEATSARIAKQLMSMGFHPVRPLAGGIHAWQEAGFAVERLS